MTLDEFKQLQPGDKFWTSMTAGISSNFITNDLGLEMDTFGVLELEYKSTGVWYGDGYRHAWFDCLVGDKIAKVHTVNLKNAFKDKDKTLAYVFRRNMDLVIDEQDKETLKRLISLYPERFI